MWYHKDKQTSACPKCDNRGNELKEHMLSHKREECIMCSECDYTCTSNAKFEAHMMMHRNEDYIDIVITAESFNCKGFGQSSEYIFDRLEACDFLGLTETWFRPYELHTICSSIQNHPKFKDSHMNYLTLL